MLKFSAMFIQLLDLSCLLLDNVPAQLPVDESLQLPVDVQLPDDVTVHLPVAVQLPVDDEPAQQLNDALPAPCLANASTAPYCIRAEQYNAMPQKLPSSSEIIML